MVAVNRGVEAVPFLRNTKVLRWSAQIISGVAAVGLVTWLAIRVVNAVEERNIPVGFGFLSRSYGGPISHHFIPYDPATTYDPFTKVTDSADSFAYSLFVAAGNTIVVSIVGVVLATVLGILIGIGRLSNNWLVSRLALSYIEFFRNVPLLIQLFFWLTVSLTLPSVREGIVLGSLFINNAGISFPWPSPTGVSTTVPWLVLAAASLLAGYFVYRRRARLEVRTGQPFYPIVSGCVAVVILGATAWILLTIVTDTVPFEVTYPVQAGRFGRISGGATIPAALMVLLIGLVMYTAAFIAEIVRAGIGSVHKGQREAARSLGLNPVRSLRYVVFPQALRVIVPPLISQFLNLTKNSSLAVAIGYSDLLSVAKTMTQVGPAISIFILVLLIYLVISLAYSLIGNLYNRKTRIRGR